MSLYTKVTPWLIVFAMSLTACGKKKAELDASAVQPFPYLGTSATYAVLAKTEITNYGASTVYGGIGLSGSNKASLNGVKRTGGDIHVNDASAKKAVADSENAYNNLLNKECDRDLSGHEWFGPVAASPQARPVPLD